MRRIKWKQVWTKKSDIIHWYVHAINVQIKRLSTMTVVFRIEFLMYFSMHPASNSTHTYSFTENQHFETNFKVEIKAVPMEKFEPFMFHPFSFVCIAYFERKTLCLKGVLIFASIFPIQTLISFSFSVWYCCCYFVLFFFYFTLFDNIVLTLWIQ